MKTDVFLERQPKPPGGTFAAVVVAADVRNAERPHPAFATPPSARFRSGIHRTEHFRLAVRFDVLHRRT